MHGNMNEKFYISFVQNEALVALTGFLESSRRNRSTSQKWHHNFRFARINEVTCPSVRQNTTQNTCNMWNNILVSDLSIFWVLKGVRRFEIWLCFRLQMKKGKQYGLPKRRSLSKRMKTEEVQENKIISLSRRPLSELYRRMECVLVRRGRELNTSRSW